MSAPKFELKSKLHEIVDQVNLITDFETKKAKTLELVRELNIKPEDKKRMLMIVEYQCHTDLKLTQYLYNSMLKFEGHGLISSKRDY
jgi:hypothetical protein